MKTKQSNETLRYIYLGLNTKGTCSVLTADLTPDQILERVKIGKLLPISFTCEGTNWCGQDELSRTCDLEGIEPVDHIKLEEPLTFDGTDYDHGHEYDWTVNVIEIMTVKSVRSKRNKAD